MRFDFHARGAACLGSSLLVVLATLLAPPPAEAQFLDKLKQKVTEAADRKGKEAEADLLEETEKVLEDAIDCVAGDAGCPAQPSGEHQAAAPAAPGAPTASVPEVQPAGSQPVTSTAGQAAALQPPSAATPAGTLQVRKIAFAEPDRSWTSDPAAVRFRDKLLIGKDLWDGASSRPVTKDFVDPWGRGWRLVAGRPDLLFYDHESTSPLPPGLTRGGWIQKDGTVIRGKYGIPSMEICGTRYGCTEAPIGGSELGPYMSSDLRRVVYIQEGDLWRADVDWLTAAIDNRRKVTDIGLIQGAPIHWYGNTLFLNAGLSREKPILRIDLMSGAVEEMEPLGGLLFGPKAVNPSGSRTCALRPGQSASSPSTLSCYDVQTGKVSELSIDLSARPGLFHLDTVWIDDETLVALHAHSGGGKAMQVQKYGPLEPAGAVRIDFRDEQIRMEPLYRAQVVEVNGVGRSDSVSALSVLPDRRHISLIATRTESGRGAIQRRVRVAVADGESVELPGVQVKGAWLDPGKFIYTKPEGGISDIGTWVYDIAAGEAAKVCHLPGVIDTGPFYAAPPFFPEHDLVYFLAYSSKRIFKASLAERKCEEVLAFDDIQPYLLRLDTPPVELRLDVSGDAIWTRASAAPP